MTEVKKRKTIWRLLFLIFSIVVLFIAILFIRAALVSSRQQPVKESVLSPFDSSAVERLKEAITIRTVTPPNPERRDTLSFTAFHKFLKRKFPLLHTKVKSETISGYTLLYTWQGTDSSLAPIVVMAHQDVVPADDSLKWKAPPFSGAEIDDFIYGRGVLDMKGSLMAILESTEFLVKRDFNPRRTICFLFGHDEESGVGKGAQAAAEILEKRYGTIEFVLDEGGLILKEALPGLDHPLALVGIAEKGFVNVELVAHGEGGHSSMPPHKTAVLSLNSALNKISKKNFPAELSNATAALFEYSAPEMKFPFRQLFTNYDILSPAIISVMEKTPSGNASIRTTTAFTILQAGNKENVIPSEAKAIINVRIMPGTTPEQVLDYFTDVIDDSAISVRQIGNASDPSVVSDTGSASFKELSSCIRTVFPEVTVAPYLVVGVTDSRHLQNISKNIYRFLPIVFLKSDLQRLHGKDERLGVNAYARMISFYTNLFIEQK